MRRLRTVGEEKSVTSTETAVFVVESARSLTLKSVNTMFKVIP